MEIEQGQLVFLRFGAANRDPSRFPDPDRYDVRRANAADHLAFGHGIHFCIGAMLARKEIHVAFRCLLAHVDHLRLAPGQTVTHKPSMLLRALNDFEVEFRPR